MNYERHCLFIQYVQVTPDHKTPTFNLNLPVKNLQYTIICPLKLK